MKIKDFFTKKAPQMVRQMKWGSTRDLLNLGSTAGFNKMFGRVALEEGYNGNTWVAACIRRRASAAASVALHVQNKDSEGNFVNAEEDSTLVRLLKTPAPGLSTSQLINMIISQWDVQGNFYAKVTLGGRGGRVPLEVIPLPIGSTEPKFSKQTGEITGYKVEGIDGLLDVEEVLHLKAPNSDSHHIGVSPLVSAGKAVDIDNSAASFQKISMNNRGIPDGVFVLDGEISAEEFEEAKRQVKTQYANKATAREPWVLGNAQFMQMSQTLADLDFMEGRRMTRQEICSALDVPLPLVHVYDDATLANVETARKIFWRDTIVPLLREMEYQLNMYFIGTKGQDKSRLRFDLSSVPALQESINDKLEAAGKMFALGIPLSQINKRLDLNLSVDEIPGATVGYLPSGMIPTSVSGSDEGAGLTSEQFNRIVQLVQMVAGGEVSSEGAVAIAEASGIPRNQAAGFFEGISASEAEKSLLDMVGYKDKGDSE